MSQRELEIRDVALTLLAEHGYNGTSMNDIAGALGIRAPSLYNHVESKQQILVAIMRATMEQIIAEHEGAVWSTEDPVDQMRRASEAHVRFHCRYRREAIVGNGEIRSLKEPARSEIVGMRRKYTDAWERLIRDGVERGGFRVFQPRLVAFAILEMGISVSMWFREDGPLSESAVAYHYADMALRMVGVSSSPIAVPAPDPGRQTSSTVSTQSLHDLT
jgi:AcrR family transcriptional regulator